MKTKLLNLFLIILFAVTGCSIKPSTNFQEKKNSITNKVITREKTETDDSSNKMFSEDDKAKKDSGSIDVDLTKLSSTMVYAEVNQMMIKPEKYVGKIVKMKGTFMVYEDMENGKRYFTCLISDATACCSQGIEFDLAGNHTYPNDYPELESDITVYGIFDTYKENGDMYCQLREAKIDTTTK